MRRGRLQSMEKPRPFRRPAPLPGGIIQERPRKVTGTLSGPHDCHLAAGTSIEIREAFSSRPRPKAP